MLDISVIVVCYNSIRFIASCFDSLVNQTYNCDHYEILFVDNQSKDGTLELLHNYALQYPNVRVVVNPVRNIARSRNIGLRQARYPFVAFIDSDCTAYPDWLSRLSDGYSRYADKECKLVGVGGANVPPNGPGWFYPALNIFLNSFLGNHGSVQGKRFQKDCYVPHLPTVNVMYRKKEIIQIGFDETLGNIGEDQDLSFRIQKAGLRVMYLKDAAVVHYMRDTLGKWLQNMFVYGKGRARLVLKHPEMIEFVLFAPLALVLVFILTMFSTVSLWFSAPFLFYLLFVFFYSILIAVDAGKPLFFAKLFVIYSSTHLSYGIGEWYGFIRYAVKN